MTDAIERLEKWKTKYRAVSIECDDGFGASCWIVELYHSKGRTVAMACGDSYREASPGRIYTGNEDLESTIHAAIDAFDSGKFEPKESYEPQRRAVIATAARVRELEDELARMKAVSQ